MLDRIRNNKSLQIIGILIIIVGLALVFRIAYAFLDDFYIDDIKKASIVGDKVDKIDFIEGGPLDLFVSSENLPLNGDDYAIVSEPKVSLIANNVTNKATINYSIYLNLENSGFIHTVNDNTPEVMLTIDKPGGERYTDNLNDLVYKTYEGVSGYDITTFNGLLTIADQIPITSNSSETAQVDTWKFTITYLNLNSSQNANLGQSINSTLVISKEPKTLEEIMRMKEEAEAGA